jgi:hypothetical protein
VSTLNTSKHTLISLSCKTDSLTSELDDSFDVIDGIGESSCEGTYGEGEGERGGETVLIVTSVGCSCWVHVS